MVYKNLDFGKIWFLLFKMTLKIRCQIRWKVHDFFFSSWSKGVFGIFPKFSCYSFYFLQSHNMYSLSQAVLKHASITGKDKSRVELIFKWVWEAF